MFVEQVIVGGCVSTTVKVNVQLAIPQLFDAVAVIVLVPTENVVPGFCE
jgi:hypothetical protein